MKQYDTEYLNILKNKVGKLKHSLLTNKLSEVKDSLKILYDETKWYTSQDKYDLKDDLKIRFKIINDGYEESDLKCKHKDCSNHKVYKMNNMVFGNYCSHECRNTDKDAYNEVSRKYKDGEIDLIKQKETRDNTMMLKYGALSACTETSKQNSRDVLKLNKYIMYQKRMDTSLKKYGVRFAHERDITNYDKYYDKDFIENNFLNEHRMILKNDFCRFFNVSSNASLRKFKDLDINHINNINGAVYNAPTILYYLEITFDNKKYYKIGITSRSVKERYSKTDYKKIKILKETQFETGRDAYIEEQKIIKDNSQYLIEENIKVLNSGGNTEVFIKDIYETK
jgi:hypothetical protein